MRAWESVGNLQILIYDTLMNMTAIRYILFYILLMGHLDAITRINDEPYLLKSTYILSCCF